MALLEREQELEAVSAVLSAACGGGGRFVAVVGNAGIGKTELLAATRAHAAEMGMRILAARGSELERDFAYGLVRQLFEPELMRTEPNDRARLFAGAAARAEPVLAGALAAPTTADTAFALLHGLYWLTINLTDHGPLLIAIDDLQWADGASLRWLAYLAHRIVGVPVAAVAATRPVGADADAAFLELLADPATVTVHPRPLSAAATAEMAQSRLVHGGALGTQLHEATGGNPLLLRELLGALAHQPLPAEPQAVADHARQLAPRVVARRVGLELAKLGRDAARLAAAVATLGDDADLEVAARLADVELAAAEDHVTRLVSADILQPGWPLRFAHPLIRQAIYEGLPPGERGRLHAQAAMLLAGGAVERVAAQLLRAPANSVPSAVPVLRQAARDAMGAGAPDSAVAYLKRALGESVDPGVRADMLLALADAEGRAAAPETAEHLREVLPLLDDPGRRTQARLTLARALFWRSREEEALAEIEAARTDAPDGPLAHALEVEYLSAALRVPGRQVAAFARVDALAPTDADETGRLLCAIKAYGTAVRGERRAEAVDLARRALARGLTTEDAPPWAYWGAVSTLLLADEFDDALSVTDEALAGARRRGAVYLYSGASMVRASLLRARGALVDAEADARAAVDAMPSRGVMIMPLAYGELAAVLVERGRLAEAADALRQAGADGPLAADFGGINLRRARSALRLARGDAAGAIADARACGEAFATVGFTNPAGAHWRSEAALGHLLAGDADAARELAREELERARRWGAPRCISRALRALGLATKDTDTLAEAAAVLDGSPAALERARALVELGAALRRAQQRVEARAQLRAGLDVAMRCGAAALVERAREELIAAGAKPRSTALSGVESLTPSERRVAGMAAEGMSNREIAQALFVTGRTVEMHLSNVFRKLDIGSRTQLVDALTSRAAQVAALAD